MPTTFLSMDTIVFFDFGDLEPSAGSLSELREALFGVHYGLACGFSGGFHLL